MERNVNMTTAPTATEAAGILQPLERLRKDVRMAAITLSRDEARFLVDAYYTWQEERKRGNNQIRALTESGEPHEVIQWLAANANMLEVSVRRVLDTYSDADPVGAWGKSIVGIGPVITAGLLAHIDIEKAPTVGHIWRFAGLDPTVQWEKKTKRPWNASLKTLCWKIGESFVKVSGRDDDIYGHVYLERKAQEQERNEAGAFAEQAAAVLEHKRIGKDTAAYYYYAGLLTVVAAHEVQEQKSVAAQLKKAKELAVEEGGIRMLPPAHIHARAKRYAVKLFISHLHHVMYEVRYGKLPPKPYILTQEGHVHFLVPPNWPR